MCKKKYIFSNLFSLNITSLSSPHSAAPRKINRMYFICMRLPPSNPHRIFFLDFSQEWYLNSEMLRLLHRPECIGCLGSGERNLSACGPLPRSPVSGLSTLHSALRRCFPTWLQSLLSSNVFLTAITPFQTFNNPWMPSGPILEHFMVFSNLDLSLNPSLSQVLEQTEGWWKIRRLGGSWCLPEGHPALAPRRRSKPFSTLR